MVVSPLSEHGARFTLEELDVLIPAVARDRATLITARNYTGNFNPHWPYPLPRVLQDRLVEFFQGLNLRRCPDGRFSGPCPLPHRDDMACDCETAFYSSPVSGSWCCFCSDHLGQSSGSVQAFALLGLDADLTFGEMQAEIGKHHLGPGAVRPSSATPIQERALPTETDVAARVVTRNPMHRSGDKPKDRGKRPSLWQEARELFPIPTNLKPRVKGSLLWSERDLQGLAVDLFSNTWRNPANAQFKRQKLFFNILPRINGPQIYQRQVPIDDWDDKVHRSVSKAIQRAMTESQGWLWFDSALKRGYMIYLTSVPGLKGFEPVDDVKPILIDALKSISPPGRDESEGRFHPYGGSQNWKGNVGGTGEEDASRWEVIATSQGPTDFIGIEAECVVAGVDTEYVPPFWRGQPNHGLAMRHTSKESFVAFAQGFPEQYTLTKSALADGVMHDPG